MFKIEMRDEIPWWIDEDDDGALNFYKTARLIVGPRDELFYFTVDYWSEKDYWRSWMEQLTRLSAGAEKAYLITTALPLGKREQIFGYPLYRFSDQVRIQDWPLYAEDTPGEIDLASPEKAMQPYSSTAEEGEQLWEAVFPLADITEFLATIQGES